MVLIPFNHKSSSLKPPSENLAFPKRLCARYRGHDTTGNPPRLYGTIASHTSRPFVNRPPRSLPPLLLLLLLLLLLHPIPRLASKTQPTRAVEIEGVGEGGIASGKPPRRRRRAGRDRGPRVVVVVVVGFVSARVGRACAEGVEDAEGAGDAVQGC